MPRNKLTQGSDSKKSTCNAGNPGSIPGLGRSPGERNGNQLQDSCLENVMEPGRLQSMGSQRVGHNLAAEQQQQSNLVSTHTEGNAGETSVTLRKHV